MKTFLLKICHGFKFFFSKEGMKWFFTSFIWLFILMFALDVISKQCIIANRQAIVDAGEHGIILIPNFLAVNYIVNHNVAFGLSITSNEMATRALFIIVALLASIGIIVYMSLKFKKLSKLTRACLMLILTGALGNCVDRIFFTGEMLKTTQTPNEINGVVDWINFYTIWGFNFNWADSCIVVGAIILIVYLIIQEIKEYRAESKLAKANNPSINEKVLSKEETKRLEDNNKEKESVNNNKNE